MADGAKKKPRAHAALMETELNAEFRRLRRAPEAVEGLRRALRQKLPEFEASWSDQRVLRETERRLQRGSLGLWLRQRSRDHVVQALEGISEVAESEREPVTTTVEKHWIEIELVGEDGSPIPGAAYRIELPDGTIRRGSLDGSGVAHVAGIEDAGSCKISFPELDKDAWEPIE